MSYSFEFRGVTVVCDSAEELVSVLNHLDAGALSERMVRTFAARVEALTKENEELRAACDHRAPATGKERGE